MKSINARLEAAERYLNELDITRLPSGKKWTERDFTAFEELCMVQSTKEEIFSIMVNRREEIDRIFIEHYGMNFDSAYQKYVAEGKRRLFNQQLKLARKSPELAKWLGIQMLNQHNKIDNCDSLEVDYESDEGI